MRVVLRQTGSQIQRKFVASSVVPFWSALELLAASPNLPDDHKTVLQALKARKKEVFFDLVDVPWYFDEVGRHVLKFGSKCSLRVKACGDYYFIQLSRADGTLIGTPFFHRYGPAKAVSTSTPAKELRGPGDLLLFLSTTLANAKDQDAATALLSWFHLELTIKTVRRSAHEHTVEVTPRLLWPGPTARWDSTGDPDKYVVEYAPSPSSRILVASSNVRKAVSGVAEVWHNPSVASVLLSAWTGSGKDPLQRLLMHGLHQPDDAPSFSAPSLAKEKPLDRIAEELVKRKLTVAPSRGKVGKLKGRTVVFVDEIHHPSAQSLREALLRPMETSEIHHGGGTYECKGLLTFLFAASEPPDELRKRDPVDFWTRIEHTIEMSHPLDLATQRERRLALEQYFALFWGMALKDGPTKDTSLLARAECSARIGGTFADLLGSPFIPIISMRMLRSIVKRIANRATYGIKTQEITLDPKKTEAERAESLGEQISDLVEEWLKELFDEIVPRLQPKGAF